jgi:hypothetical protein
MSLVNVSTNQTDMSLARAVDKVTDSLSQDEHLEGSVVLKPLAANAPMLGGQGQASKGQNKKGRDQTPPPKKEASPAPAAVTPQPEKEASPAPAAVTPPPKKGPAKVPDAPIKASKDDAKMEVSVAVPSRPLPPRKTLAEVEEKSEVELLKEKSAALKKQQEDAAEEKRRIDSLLAAKEAQKKKDEQRVAMEAEKKAIAENSAADKAHSVAVAASKKATKDVEEHNAILTSLKTQKSQLAEELAELPKDATEEVRTKLQQKFDACKSKLKSLPSLETLTAVQTQANDTLKTAKATLDATKSTLDKSRTNHWTKPEVKPVPKPATDKPVPMPATKADVNEQPYQTVGKGGKPKVLADDRVEAIKANKLQLRDRDVPTQVTQPQQPQESVADRKKRVAMEEKANAAALKQSELENAKKGVEATLAAAAAASAPARKSPVPKKIVAAALRTLTETDKKTHALGVHASSARASPVRASEPVQQWSEEYKDFGPKPSDGKFGRTKPDDPERYNPDVKYTLEDGSAYTYENMPQELRDILNKKARPAAIDFVLDSIRDSKCKVHGLKQGNWQHFVDGLAEKGDKWHFTAKLHARAIAEKGRVHGFLVWQIMLSPIFPGQLTAIIRELLYDQVFVKISWNEEEQTWIFSLSYYHTAEKRKQESTPRVRQPAQPAAAADAVAVPGSRFSVLSDSPRAEAPRTEAPRAAPKPQGKSRM